MDLLIKTDLNTIPASIDFNFEEVRTELEDKLTYYKNLVVTADGIKAAKADKAKLNKLAAAIDERRKEVKAMCLAPYADFETKCKDLVSLIKAPVAAIDTQVKAFEDLEKKKKYAELQLYFDGEVRELSELVTLDKIINPKWGNVTAKIDTLKNEIGDTLDRIRTDLNTINQQYADVPYKAAILTEYCKKYDLSKTLVYAAQLAFEVKAQDKALKSAPETVSKPADVTPEPVPGVLPGCEKNVVTETVGSVAFEVTCTRSQLLKLRDYMTSNGIVFHVVKKQEV